MPTIKVFLYMSDYNAMCAEIYRYPRIETGGNLFGSWTMSGDVVIYAALGPGKGCRRTEHTFHQDIPYLERVSRFLNHRHMLCHVGEWRSHHHSSLKEPSTGHVRTVWDNYPLGMKKFLVIIGNLVASDQVLVSPYFFLEGRGREYVKGKFEVLEGKNPFSLDLDITRVMENGSELQQREIRRGVAVENSTWFMLDMSNNAQLLPSDHVPAYTNRPQHYETGLVNISTSSETGTTSGTTTQHTSSNDSPVKTPPRDFATVVASSGTPCPTIKVFLYMSDYNAMCAEIYRYPRIETGGNLFGSWTMSGDVVIHAALGPGKGCRRTEHAFHQDIPYLEHVSRFLNHRHMLCHVGEWRSHHQSSLKEPSTGDVRTVWDNYPLGMKKFLVIIGNLVASDQVLVSPYFFLEGRRREYFKGKFKVLEGKNPFSLDLDITRVMEKGSEHQEREIRRGVAVENSSTSPDSEEQSPK